MMANKRLREAALAGILAFLVSFAGTMTYMNLTSERWTIAEAGVFWASVAMGSLTSFGVCYVIGKAYRHWRNR